MTLPTEVQAVVYSQNRASCECARCGRYLGALEVCPFCRFFNPKRWPVFLVKYLSPFAAIIGIALLFHLGNVRGDPEVHVRDLGRRTNFAQVVLDGTMSSGLRFYPSDMGTQRGRGTLEFRLDDGTGILKIRAYEDVTQELVARGIVPAPGDRLRVRGTYQYKARSDFVIIGSATSLEVIPPEIPEASRLSDLVDAPPRVRDGQPVRIEGWIRSVDVDRYDVVYQVADSIGETIEVLLSRSVLDLLDISAEGEGARSRVGPPDGSHVEIHGVLRWSGYENAYRIAIGSPGRIRVTDRTGEGKRSSS